MKLKVPYAESKRRLASVPHATFQRAVERRWVRMGTAAVTAQSACWLFCWAKTGMGSQAAANAAMGAFNELLGVSYDRFDARVDHGAARDLRYRRGDVEDELLALLRR